MNTGTTSKLSPAKKSIAFQHQTLADHILSSSCGIHFSVCRAILPFVFSVNHKRIRPDMKTFTEPFSFLVPAILACAVSFDLSTGFSSSRRSWRAYTVKDSGGQKTDSNFVYTHTTRSRDLKIDASSLATAFDTRLVPDVKVRMSSTYGKHLSSDQGSRLEEALYSEDASREFHILNLVHISFTLCSSITFAIIK